MVCFTILVGIFVGECFFHPWKFCKDEGLEDRLSLSVFVFQMIFYRFYHGNSSPSNPWFGEDVFFFQTTQQANLIHFFGGEKFSCRKWQNQPRFKRKKHGKSKVFSGWTVRFQPFHVEWPTSLGPGPPFFLTSEVSEISAEVGVAFIVVVENQ